MPCATSRPWRQLISFFLLFVGSTSALSSTVYFRKQSTGSIFTLDSRDGTEAQVPGSQDTARLVGLALGSLQGLQCLYWSDNRAIRSAWVNGTDAHAFIGALVRVQWIGTNFGSTRSELLELAVKGTRCVSVLQWNSTFVDCLVAIPDRYPVTIVDGSPPFVAETDCSLRTVRGVMTGFVRNYAEMVATGYPSPIVRQINIQASFVLPHALAIHGNDLFWSNRADGKIYRSSLVDTSISIVASGVWDVPGMTVMAIPSTSNKTVFYSLESKGELRQVLLRADATPRHHRTILTDLKSPRGLAIDPIGEYLYYTEKTARIYRVKLDQWTNPTLLSELQVDATLSSVTPSLSATNKPQLLLTLSTLTRLDGLAVDDRFLYWCESNANVVARASTAVFERQVVVGGSADSKLR
ncbi:hypothetical protein Poli38472_008417 [Pythium oligandrum]|uniref:Uncharacterized protein n=1 Tax=Pythium oligandrum TaxID=41045 RepID=A0A8K1FJ75_PYTOL|nr:hypothetical protein Poli38472_008417 [Pythium oligandrum]|eukprot:TMW65775.1 hypothetical protein Poli38472_008417 [Pythium oligandrum]